MLFSKRLTKPRTIKVKIMKKAKLFMDTVVEIEVISQKSNEEIEWKMDRAFTAFKNIEQTCSRFSNSSELMQACQQVGTPAAISPFLYEPLFYALEMAKLTDGLFDPTVGKSMEKAGFNRHYLTGTRIDSLADESVSYHDITLDQVERTLTLSKPLVIDLGAVAKGFAIDLAANELRDFEGFIVNAGGDIFAGGADPNCNKWTIGIQHPYQKENIIDSIQISNEAICTSGSYERRNSSSLEEHHLINPKTKCSPNDWVSCSVVAPFAMMADGFSTAVFLQGFKNGRSLMEDLELRGFLITPDLHVVRIGGI
jgi:thiamine biosynthesis lipoprotein